MAFHYAAGSDDMTVRSIFRLYSGEATPFPPRTKLQGGTARRASLHLNMHLSSRSNVVRGGEGELRRGVWANVRETRGKALVFCNLC